MVYFSLIFLELDDYMLYSDFIWLLAFRLLPLSNRAHQMVSVTWWWLWR